MQHLFFKCPSVKKIIKEIEAIFNRSGLTANIEIKELNIMLGLYGGEDLDVIFMLFRKSSNLFLSFSLICEICNVHCKCFFKLFFQVLKIV
jgi:hypothetical protein